MQDTQNIAPFRHEFQTFTWVRDEWDIARLIRDIDSKKLVPPTDTLDRDFIEAYAQQVLLLNRNPPAADGARRISFYMHVNPVAARALPACAFDEPLIMLETRKGAGLLRLEGRTSSDHVLADGQHRLAKAYFEDVASLKMYIVPVKDSKKYLLK